MAANPWDLPTTGNLAFDDFTRAQDAWMQLHPYIGNEVYNNSDASTLVGGGVDSLSNLNPERDAWDLKQRQGFGATLTPEQSEEWKQLGAERNAKLRRNGQLAAMASFAAVGGLGALGNGVGAAAPSGLSGYYTGMGGVDGSLVGSGVTNATGWGAGGLGAAGGDLGMAGWMGPGTGEMGLGTGTAGLASGAGAGAAGASAGAAGASPWKSFLESITKNVGTKLGGSLLSQLISAGGNAYAGNKQAGQYGDVINQINQLYAPDSPYAQQMQQTLARKDAAAGRNSQYGSRAVELAAALTQAKSNALTSQGYGNLLGQRGINQNSILNGFAAALSSSGGQDLISRAGSGIGNYLSKFFGSSGSSYSPTAPNTGFTNPWADYYSPG